MTVIVAIVLVGVILPLMGIVVDVGLSRMLSQQSRGAADAGALAAAGAGAGLKLHPESLTEAEIPGGAVDQAKALVEVNVPAPDIGWGAAWQQCADANHLAMVSTAYATGTCISFDFMKKQVRVKVPDRPVPTIFSALLGTTSLVAAATSTGTWGTDARPTCGLCVLGTYKSATGRVSVSGDGVAIGGDLDVSGVTLNSGSVTYAGKLVQDSGVTPPLVHGLPPDDPFAAWLSVNGPSIDGQQSQPPASGDCRPGIYQDISACASFAPGRYFVTGTGSQTNVTLKASASNVVLFFTCGAGTAPLIVAAPCTPSWVQPHFTGPATGGKAITIAAPVDSTGVPGLALVFDNGMNGTGGIVGGGTLIINGDVYGRDVVLGNVGTNTMTVNGHVVVGSVNYTSAKPTLTVVAPPPVPKPVPDGPVRLAATG